MYICNMKKLIFFLCLVFSINKVSAQTMTLQQCVDYALENNIQLKQSRISAEESRESLQQSKAALLPSLSASTNQNVSWRPWSQSTVNLASGTLTSTTSSMNYNGTYGVSANMTVWNGGKNTKTVEQNKLQTQISELNTNEQENNIIEQIALLYVEILFQREAVNVNETVLHSSKVAYDRGKEMYNVGSISKSDFVQLESQMAQDNYSLVTSRTQLDNYKFQLKQLLEITGSDDFDVVAGGVADDRVLAAIPQKEDVYNAAVRLRPEIQSGRLNVKSNELGIDIAKAGYMPQVSLNAGINTSNASGMSDAVGTQLKTNLSNSLGMSVSVPIFDQRQNKTAVAKAKLQHANSQLSLQQAEKDLYKKIENYWLDATNCQQQYIYSETSVKSNRESYRLLSEKFQLGLVNIVELNNGKTNLIQAEQQYLEAKYRTLYNVAMLNFYQGKSLEL